MKYFNSFLFLEYKLTKKNSSIVNEVLRNIERIETRRKEDIYAFIELIKETKSAILIAEGIDILEDQQLFSMISDLCQQKKLSLLLIINEKDINYVEGRDLEIECLTIINKKMPGYRKILISSLSLLKNDYEKEYRKHAISELGAYFIEICASTSETDLFITYLARLKEILNFSALYLYSYNKAENLYKVQYSSIEKLDANIPLHEIAVLEAKGNNFSVTYEELKKRRILKGITNSINNEYILYISLLHRQGGISHIILINFQKNLILDSTPEICLLISNDLAKIVEYIDNHKILTAIKKLALTKQNINEKDVLLEQLLKNIKGIMNVDGVSLVEMISEESDGKALFEKKYIHLDRKLETVQFAADGGYAHCCLKNEKIFIINERIEDAERPYGKGIEYEVINDKIFEKAEIEIQFIIAPKTLEFEKSLIYLPIRFGDKRLSALKLASFESPYAFGIAELKKIIGIRDIISGYLSTMEDIDRQYKQIQRRETLVKMGAQAEALFFYREIALGIFHQLRNHLNAMQSNLLLINVLTDALQKENQDLKDLVASCRILKKDCTELLERAEVRGRTLKPIMKEISLCEAVIKPAIRYAEKRVQDSKIRITKSLTNKDYIVKLDQEYALEAFINLLNNSIKAIKENKYSTKKEIFIAVRKIADESKVRIEITDSGVGIEPQIIGTLFQPYVTTWPDGTGLGLYFSKLLFEYFEGNIRFVRSVPKKGTSIEVILPMIKAIKMEG